INHLQPLLPDTATFSEQGTLQIAGHSVVDLVEQHGTPLYIFDRATIVRACQNYMLAFRETYTASESLILYAAKAYLSPLVARMIAEQGMGLDVVSAGELLLALRAQFPPERISFHGNNKSEEELLLALRAGVGRIVLDNWSELEHLTRLANAQGIKPGVLLRVAPEVETDTHRYLQTGHASSKFGFHLGNGEARAALLRILQEDQLDLLGLHAHTGTMLRETRPYTECLERLLALAFDLYHATGWWPREVSPGGGWAINTPGESDTPDITILASALQSTMLQSLAESGLQIAAPRLIIEPGRSIIARAALAIYRIGARKHTPGGITYLFVDGGMADNIRPALYGSVYTAFPVEKALENAEETVCISGRFCESGDLLVQAVRLPFMCEGDLLALPTVGAYCLPMASNYNLVPRPAVLLTDTERIQLMERRETHEDLFLRYNV
ncbi:MAG TPA: diaminopimelate decarboxylase, partial [Ktedonobacteraceae bacterium]|nr:diaminopimelate decarboxylase [Ktedonobacteraceae bacterium]